MGIEHRRTGDTVTIRAYRKAGRWLLFGRGPHLLVLRVPNDAELDLETDTGSIRVAGVDGEKRLSTDTGRVEVTASRGGVWARTDTGSHLYSQVVGNIQARAGTGGMTLEHVEGILQLNADTGSIQGSWVRLTGNSVFNTDTGSITLDFDQGIDQMSFDLRTDTGTVSVNDTESRGRLVTGQGTVKVTAQTDTGSIRIRGP